MGDALMTTPVEASRAFMQAAERLPSLFSLTESAVRLLALLEEGQGDTDGAELERQFEEAAAALVQKFESCAWTVTDLEALATARANEARRLAAQAKSIEAVADRLRARMLAHMHAIGQERIVTPRYTLSVRANPPRVDVLEAQLVPKDYERTRITVEPDKRAILEHWRATGEIVPGVEVVRGERLAIS